MARRRDEKGRFSLLRGNPPNKVLSKGKKLHEVNHDYFPQQPSSSKCRDDAYENINLGKHVGREGWKEGCRRIRGYLYVRCMNPDCGQVNIAPYWKTHRQKKKGMPCFVANTKLGTCKFICLQNYRLVL